MFLISKKRIVFKLIKDFLIGLAALIAAVWLLSYIIKVNPYDEYLLITKSITTNGFITNAEEYEHDVDLPDAEGGGSATVTDVNYTYHFTTKDGKTITDESSELGYIEYFKGRKIPIQIEYLPDNPKVNRVKDANYQCKTIGEFIWRRVGLGMLTLLIFCSFGFHLIHTAIKDYINAKKN